MSLIILLTGLSGIFNSIKYNNFNIGIYDMLERNSKEIELLRQKKKN